MRIEDVQAYELIEKRKIEDLNSMSYILKHKKTGARVALLSNDDNNKVFNIAFRTTPTDSTGVPHIIEHTVLCGSKQFPVKDPFVELVKGSLNTFINAMTYADKTMYPVASCNDKDFQNLCHVYMDAVFYPNIYKEEKIFKQEGWHYEMETADSDLTINGVVYNEMKGAFSSPDDINDRTVINSLFPDTTYGVESGGDPKDIPNLTYEEYLDFHRKYYHPSNSYIYLYGDMDMAEKLIWMDEEYLSKFDSLYVDSTIEMQKAFDKPIYMDLDYPIMEGESLENNTYLSYNVVVGTSLDKELYYAFDLIDYALCSSSGAPLKQALIHKNIGTEVYSYYENGIMQPYFSIVSKNANDSQRDEFVQTIEEELRKAVKQGIDKKALLAGLNFYEFRYREADFGSYPKGLMYGLQMFDSWLYDDNAPFTMVEANDIFAKLRDYIETDYFEKLIEKYILNNNHKSVLRVSPKEGLAEKEEKELEEKLAAYKASLSKEEIDKIVRETKELKEYQESEDDPEALLKIPMLSRADMKKEAEGFINEVREVDGTKVIFHDVYTNGIGYIKLIFDAKNIPTELFSYIGILKNILGYVDTQNFQYGELFNEINIHTGGIGSTVNTYVNSKRLDEYKLTFEIKSKAMYASIEKTIELITEIMTTSSLKDEARILEIVAELKSRLQGSMTSSGHSLAAIRSISYFSETAAVSELVNGIPCMRLLEKIEADYDGNKVELISKLEELIKCIFRPENLMIDLTSDEKGFEILSKCIPTLKSKLFTTPVKNEEFKIELSKKNEGFETSAQIQYVARSGNYMTSKNLPYTGAFRVLKVILGYEYLWTNVRVKGGAYGVMCNFGKNGESYLVSYRDPNLKKTMETFEKTGDYLRTFTVDDRTMTKYIIGAISDMDIPMTPQTKGSRSLGAYLSNVELADVQKERDELLACEQEDIRALAKYLDAIMEENALCVVGNSQAIEENKDMFNSVEPLFH